MCYASESKYLSQIIIEWKIYGGEKYMGEISWIINLGLLNLSCV